MTEAVKWTADKHSIVIDMRELIEKIENCKTYKQRDTDKLCQKLFKLFQKDAYEQYYGLNPNVSSRVMRVNRV